MVQKQLYLFNPDHDLALANQDPNYMSPVLVRQLADDLAILPVWYGGADDFVLAPSRWNATWLASVREDFPGLPSLITEPEVAYKDLIPSPWGWNPAIRKRLHLLGAKESVLPTQDELAHFRICSSRQLAVRLLPQLQLNEWFCGESFYLSTTDEVETFLRRFPVCVLKAPLSGSGRGLNWCRHGATPPIVNWCKNVIKKQGGVAAEPSYDKVLDFAMQFYTHKGKVSFQGYSLFYTSVSGAYDGNLLAGNNEIEQRLANYIPLKCLNLLQKKLKQVLSDSLDEHYTGYLGVDMMICRFPEDYRLHPCVEINLRMNMGMTSRLICDRYVSPSRTGVFKVVYYSSTDDLLKEDQRMRMVFPLDIQEGKIFQGYFKLVPPHPTARYSAYILVD